MVKLIFGTHRANVLQLTLIATWYGVCYEKAFPMDFVSDRKSVIFVHVRAESCEGQRYYILIRNRRSLSLSLYKG